MLIRILFVLSTLLVLAQSAPSPYFTRSFVQTPSSTYEQYIIVPDKNDAYRVPMSQVHHFSDFQFPKQQVVYYNPSTDLNQHKLESLKNDNPLWQQMLINLHGKSGEIMEDKAEILNMSENMDLKDRGNQKVMNEDTMRMILDQENLMSYDMMEKLKRDDTKISEMIRVLEESTTFTPKILPSNEEMNNEGKQYLMESLNNSTDQVIRVSPLIHLGMTRVIIPKSSSTEIQKENLIELNEIKTENPLVLKIAERISDIEPFETSTSKNQDTQKVSTAEQPALRRSKEMTLQIMRNIKKHPEIMIKIVELAAASIQEMESDLIDESMENLETFTEQSISITENPKIESTESLEVLLKTDDRRNVLESSTINPVTNFSSESIHLLTEMHDSTITTEFSVSDIKVPFPSEISMTAIETNTPISSESSKPQFQSRFDDFIISIEKSETAKEALNNEIDVISTTTQIPMQQNLETTARIDTFSDSGEDLTDIPVSTENIIETTQIAELSSSSTESELIESSTVLETINRPTETEFPESSQKPEIKEESTETITESVTDSSQLQETSSIISSGIIQRIQIIQISMHTKTNNSDQGNSTLAENIGQSTPVSDMPINSNYKTSNDKEISSSDEQISYDSSEKESKSQEKQVTLQETPQSELRETMKEGRVNIAPTMFLHNNRFYVISGEPEFYANFDAYQNPRTPIFSLQELQPIKPMNNVAIQNIEPFRIYVEENEEQKSTSTQNDNELLKMQDSSTENPWSDIENTQPMNMEQREPELERELTVKVKKQEQERLPNSEARQEDYDEDKPSVAVANPEATSNSDLRGVASADRKSRALSNQGCISVGSPKETAIGGKFKLNDCDDGNNEDDVKVQNRRELNAAKRKVMRGRRY